MHGDGCLLLLRDLEAIISAAVIYLRWSSITQMRFLLISPHNPRQIVIGNTVSGVRFRSIQPINPLRLHNFGNGPTTAPQSSPQAPCGTKVRRASISAIDSIHLPRPAENRTLTSLFPSDAGPMDVICCSTVSVGLPTVK